MTEPVHRPPLVQIVRRTQYARIRVATMDQALKIAETLEDWSVPELEPFDVVEASPNEE